MNRSSDASRRGLSKGALAVYCGFAILFAGFTALGIWQVQRLFWKLDLIEQVNTRVLAQPVPAPLPQVHVTRADDQYRRVEVRGQYDHSKESRVKAVTELGAGYWVMTPLTTDQGFSVLINRGFVPPEKAEPATRPEGQVTGDHTVIGLLRITEPGGGFMRDNDPQAGRWFSRDVEQIMATQQVPRPHAAYFIDAGASDLRWPRGGMTVVKFANSHLVYALTWFGLAGMSLFGLWLFVREQGRRRRGAA